MRVSSFTGIGKGVGILLSVLLIALRALALSTTEQEQSAKVQSDTIQSQPAITLIDAAQVAINGKYVAEIFSQAPLFGVVGCVAGILIPALFSLLIHQNGAEIWTRFGDSSFTGCLIGSLFGAFLGLTGNIVKKVSPSDFVGKPPEYIASYLTEYKSARRKAQLKAYYFIYIPTTSCMIFTWFVVQDFQH